MKRLTPSSLNVPKNKKKRQRYADQVRAADAQRQRLHPTHDQSPFSRFQRAARPDESATLQLPEGVRLVDERTPLVPPAYTPEVVKVEVPKRGGYWRELGVGLAVIATGWAVHFLLIERPQQAQLDAQTAALERFSPQLADLQAAQLAQVQALSQLASLQSELQRTTARSHDDLSSALAAQERAVQQLSAHVTDLAAAWQQAYAAARPTE